MKLQLLTLSGESSEINVPDEDPKVSDVCRVFARQMNVPETLFSVVREGNVLARDSTLSSHSVKEGDRLVIFPSESFRTLAFPGVDLVFPSRYAEFATEDSEAPYLGDLFVVNRRGRVTNVRESPVGRWGYISMLRSLGMQLFGSEGLPNVLGVNLVEYSDDGDTHEYSDSDNAMEEEEEEDDEGYSDNEEPDGDRNPLGVGMELARPRNSHVLSRLGREALRMLIRDMPDGEPGEHLLEVPLPFADPALAAEPFDGPMPSDDVYFMDTMPFGGEPPGGRGEVPELEIPGITQEDREQIDRLCGMGFERSMVVQVYEACGRDPEQTFTCLVSMT